MGGAESLFNDLAEDGEEYGDEMRMIQNLLGGALTQPQNTTKASTN